MKLVPIFCPDCCRVYHAQASDDAPERHRDGSLREWRCPTCHAAACATIAARDALCPSAESLGLLGSTATLSELPIIRTQRPGGSGRRIVRKSEPMAG